MSLQTGDKILMDKKIYFWGLGRIGRQIYEMSKDYISIDGFIDSDRKKQDQLYDGKIKVYTPEEVTFDDSMYVIITMNPQAVIIRKDLEKRGLKHGEDFCTYKEWFKKLYQEKGVLLQGNIEVYITDYCNLKCKDCGVLVPYVKKKKHRDIEVIKKDIETYFSLVDKVSWFNILGGEALLHPYIDELIEYVGETVRDKIQRATILTNGVLVPRDETLRLLKKYNFEIDISDYRLPITQKVRGKLLEKIEWAGLIYNLLPMDHWIHFYDNPPASNGFNNEDLKNLFNECNWGCRVLFDKKVYFCSNDRALQEMGLIQGDRTDYYLLEGEDREILRAGLCDFDLGKLRKGYVTLCKYCNGGRATNMDYIPVAEQLV